MGKVEENPFQAYQQISYVIIFMDTFSSKKGIFQDFSFALERMGALTCCTSRRRKSPMNIQIIVQEYS